MSEFRKGVKDGLPICFGYFAVSFAFGIQAGDAGLTPFQAVLMSLTNVTSAGQFASLGSIAAGASYVEMAFLQLIINMRYFLMSCALSQKFKTGEGLIHRFLIAYGVTDEIFGVSVLRPGDLKPAHSYGMILISVFGWCMGTLVGVVSGDILPGRVINALGIAIYGMFIAIVLPAAKRDRSVMLTCIAAICMACLFQYIPYFSRVSSGMRIIIITIVTAGAAAWLFPHEEGGED